MSACRCGSGASADACCAPLLAGAAAPSPERLMRSRFVAYALKNVDYILDTTDPQRRLEVDPEAVRRWMDEAEFDRLDVVNASEDGTKGFVEFKAHYRGADGARHVHHEESRFRKQDGRWYFRTGKVREPARG